MRLAQKADHQAFAHIFRQTMLLQTPGAVINEETFRTLKERLLMKGTVVSCTDDTSAFIVCDRENKMLWRVAMLMPMTMDDAVGKALITFAFLAEHKLRPLDPLTVCFTELDRGKGGVEDRTHDAWRTLSSASSDSITDASGAVVKRRLHLTAQQVAGWLGVTL